MADDKKVDKTSQSYQSGYKEGYTDKDKGIIDHFFEQVTDWTKFSGGNDDYKEGFAEGQKDRTRDDIRDEKKK